MRRSRGVRPRERLWSVLPRGGSQAGAGVSAHGELGCLDTSRTAHFAERTQFAKLLIYSAHRRSEGIQKGRGRESEADRTLGRS